MSQKQLEIDPQIDWLPINLSAQELGLHPSQIRRDRSVLTELGLIRYTRKGLTRKAFECIKLFRKLVNERGRGEAINVIGDKWDEHQRQAGSGRSQKEEAIC